MSSFSSSLPTSRRPDPHDAPALRWGILGTGWIADKFHTSLRHTGQEVVAVGSRSDESAQAFAEGRGVRAHGTYEALAADPEVDAIYVATPHPQHRENALLAIEAGKHVLVEKPFAINAAQSQEIADAARAAGVFAMEALWSRLLPKWDVIAQLVADGALGEIRGVYSDHGENFAPDHRIKKPELAGGAMLDMGLYDVAFTDMVLGSAPAEVAATGWRGPSGVVENIGASLLYDGGATSIFHTSTDAVLPVRASISGSSASIVVETPFFMPGPFTLTDFAGHELRYDEERVAHEALYVSAVEAARCIGEGLTESPALPLDGSIRRLALMDRIREACGDRFVME